MRYAATKHNAQKEPGHDLPYLVHVVSVAAEVIARVSAHAMRDASRTPYSRTKASWKSCH